MYDKQFQFHTNFNNNKLQHVGKSLKYVNKSISKTRVSIEKQSKLSEIAAPTLNSISEVYPLYFQH